MLNLTYTQKKNCQAIVNIFETGSPQGDYSATSILADGAGITFGRTQATDRAGSLDLIVSRYHDAGGIFDFSPYVDILAVNKSTAYVPKRSIRVIKNTAGEYTFNNPEYTLLDPGVRLLMLLLAKAADQDPKMAIVQGEVFDELYWNPAVNLANKAGCELALSAAVIYDTCIQSGPNSVGKIRSSFAAASPARGGGEKNWLSAYVTARYNFLANFTSSDPNTQRLVRNTVYRPRAFQELIEQQNWDLDKNLFKISLVQHSVTIP